MVKDFVVVCERGEVNKTFFLSFNFLFLLYLVNRGGGGEDVATAARLATGSGSVCGEYLGRGTPCGTTNPS